MEERNREETKRLLYVAVTRARERLYLSAVLKNGTLRPGPGSLAEVLPPSIRDLFVEALAQPVGARLEWRAESGGSHHVRVVAADQAPKAARPDGDRGRR